MKYIITPGCAMPCIAAHYGTRMSDCMPIAEDEHVKTEAARVLNSFPPGADDIFAHIGVMFGRRAEDKVYMLNALYGGCGADFYPEMLFKHPFAERSGGANIYPDITQSFAHHNIYFFAICGGPRLDGPVEQILDWLDTRASYKTQWQETVFSDAETAAIEQTIKSMRLTVSMKHDFITLITKYKRRHGKIDILRHYTGADRTAKREAKAAYAELRAGLME